MHLAQLVLTIFHPIRITKKSNCLSPQTHRTTVAKPFCGVSAQAAPAPSRGEPPAVNLVARPAKQEGTHQLHGSAWCGGTEAQRYPCKHSSIRASRCYTTLHFSTPYPNPNPKPNMRTAAPAIPIQTFIESPSPSHSSAFNNTNNNIVLLSNTYNTNLFSDRQHRHHRHLVTVWTPPPYPTRLVDLISNSTGHSLP